MSQPRMGRSSRQTVGDFLMRALKGLSYLKFQEDILALVALRELVTRG